MGYKTSLSTLSTSLIKLLASLKIQLDKEVHHKS